MAKSVKVLFVCIGNSCRSPMSESVLKGIIADSKNTTISWEVDSAALADWNVGYPPENRCLKVLSEHQLDSNHIGRQITKEDYFHFNYILAMDEYNLSDLNKQAPDGHTSKIELLGTYGMNKDEPNIPDPYFEKGVESFKRAYNLIEPACRNFFELQYN